MVRIEPVDVEETEGKVKELLAGVDKMLGATPNLFRTAARAPSALDALVSFFGAAARGKLSPRAREAIALVVSEANGCDYCVSAHAALGARAGLTPDAIDAARDAASTDPKVAAMLRFARELTVERGQSAARAVDAARTAGLSDVELVEIVSNVALTVFTNYVNLVADTEIDFPVVRTR